jgi:hypothetical protein
LAQMEDEKSFQRGLIVMGDLPGWNVLKRRHDRTRMCTIQDIGAQMSIWKEIGPTGNEGWKAHSIGGRVRKYTT